MWQNWLFFPPLSLFLCQLVFLWVSPACGAGSSCSHRTLLPHHSPTLRLRFASGYYRRTLRVRLPGFFSCGFPLPAEQVRRAHTEHCCLTIARRYACAPRRATTGGRFASACPVFFLVGFPCLRGCFIGRTPNTVASP